LERQMMGESNHGTAVVDISTKVFGKDNPGWCFDSSWFGEFLALSDIRYVFTEDGIAYRKHAGNCHGYCWSCSGQDLIPPVHQYDLLPNRASHCPIAASYCLIASPIRQ
jgi:hypothetical protein